MWLLSGTLATVFAALVGPTSFGPLNHVDDSNYADRMLTPFDGSHVKPKLVASRKNFPLKVVVLNQSPYFTPLRFQLVKDACLAWSEATKSVPGGGATMEVIQAQVARGADVIIWLGTRSQALGYEGMTRELGPAAVISLGVVDEGVPVSDTKLKRVTMHEFGHALGIWGHSPDATDIMSLHDETLSISSADVNTLVLAYTAKSKR